MLSSTEVKEEDIEKEYLVRLLVLVVKVAFNVLLSFERAKDNAGPVNETEVLYEDGSRALEKVT